MPPRRQAIMDELQTSGPTTMSTLADRLGITAEGVRQQIHLLEQEGLVHRVEPVQHEVGQVGRPAHLYELTPKGDSFFPKRYDVLSMSLMDAIESSLGAEALETVLDRLADMRVTVWRPRMEGLSLEEKVHALAQLHNEHDNSMMVESTGPFPSIVSHNCPVTKTAMNRPRLCDYSVRVMSELMGYKVIRDQRLQEGDGQCRFRILLDQPIEGRAGPDVPESHHHEG